uniref:Uncharacterized protein n=1 Tax=Attheya septentrionalis TaxID=420275 RepID=A0A6T7IGF4_9STRA|mmetsp:Transcript_25584/g.46333  ORF Transcript_25584/g.46333 Transcript_25584/m.46333 type:complete len:213 (+) Transcript_25584:157-795(+)
MNNQKSKTLLLPTTHTPSINIITLNITVIRKMGRRMRIHNSTGLQEDATKPSYWGKSQRDALNTRFEASEPMAVPDSNSRKYHLSSSSMSLGGSSVDGIEDMYDWATWRMYDRITSARKQASLARVLAGESDQTPARVFSRVDVNKPQDEETRTPPLAFHAIPSNSRTTINHRHERYTYEDTSTPSLVSESSYEEDFVGESYHEGEVFTLEL